MRCMQSFKALLLFVKEQCGTTPSLILLMLLFKMYGGWIDEGDSSNEIAQNGVFIANDCGVDVMSFLGP